MPVDKIEYTVAVSIQNSVVLVEFLVMDFVNAGMENDGMVLEECHPSISLEPSMTGGMGELYEESCVTADEQYDLHKGVAIRRHRQ